jgi:hypothetical protein
MHCTAVSIDTLDVDTLACDPDKVNVIRESLRIVGQRLPLLVDRKKMKVLRGAATLVAMRQLSLEDASETNPAPESWGAAWAVMIDESEVESVALMLADRQSAELNELDFGKMYSQFGDALNATYEPGEVSMMQAEVAHILGMGPSFAAQREDIKYDEDAKVHAIGKSAHGGGAEFTKLERAQRLADAQHARTKLTPGGKANEFFKGKVIVHLTEEQSAIFLLCYPMIRDEFDQGEITNGEAFIYALGQWMRGKGREIPLERPAEDF